MITRVAQAEEALPADCYCCGYGTVPVVTWVPHLLLLLLLLMLAALKAVFAAWMPTDWMCCTDCA